MNRPLRHATFLAGLAALAWVGAGYVGANPLALVVTALIAAFYLAGALELRRFQAATAALAQAVDALAAPLADTAGLRAWLDRLPVALRNAVRRRVEGEPVGLPGPVMTPYLAGLLVLLGMLGTFLGMVLTLRGTGLALDSATDLQAVRASLVAPVRGLGLAFGTSIAGVAASAALGLLSALCRRERVQVAQQLDARIATTLRVFSIAHQREESLRLQQGQAELMPALVDGLRSMMEVVERQAEAANMRLLARQDDFHAQAEGRYAVLAASVDRSLKNSLEHSAHVAGETIRPVAEATMAAIARETAALGDGLAETMRRQIEQLSARFEASTAHAADAWQTALARHEDGSRRLADDLRASHDRFADTFEQRSAALLDDVGQRHAALQDGHQRLAEDLRASHDRFAGTFEQRSAALLDDVGQRHAALQEGSRRLADDLRASHDRFAGTFEQRSAALLDDAGQRHAALQQGTAAAMAEIVGKTAELQARVAGSVSAQLDGVTARLDETARQVTAAWAEAIAQHERVNERTAATTHDALAAAAATFERHSSTLLATVARTHEELESGAAARESARTAAFTQAIEAMGGTLQREWQEAGAQAFARHQDISATMERTARDITTQAETHARSTTAEIARLLDAAAQAPRAAAEVIAELRDKLSDSMARDNALLDERARMLQTLGTLLDAVNQAATEQRGAIDALVGSSATLLDRVGARFAEQVDAEAGKLAEAAAQVTGSAVEVASLGESFGHAVQLFTESNDKLGAQLQRIDGALAKSLARSDEQLAYYVAQAREVIELSVMSQQQIIESLQRLSGRAVAEGTTT